MAVLLIAVLLGGCRAHRGMVIPGQPPPRPNATGVAPGDRVRITRQDSTRLSFTVAEVRTDALVSTTGQRIGFDSMTRLEARKFAAGRTLLLVGGLLGALTLLVAGLTAAAYGSFASGL